MQLVQGVPLSPEHLDRFAAGIMPCANSNALPGFEEKTPEHAFVVEGHVRAEQFLFSLALWFAGTLTMGGP